MYPVAQPKPSVVEPTPILNEKGARFDTGHGPAKFRIINENRTNDVGNPVSYEIMAANLRLPHIRARFM